MCISGTVLECLPQREEGLKIKQQMTRYAIGEWPSKLAF